MSPEVFDFVVPLYRVRWNTRAVVEGITTHYHPRSIHVIAPTEEVHKLNKNLRTGRLPSLICTKKKPF